MEVGTWHGPEAWQLFFVTDAANKDLTPYDRRSQCQTQDSACLGNQGAASTASAPPGPSPLLPELIKETIVRKITAGLGM